MQRIKHHVCDKTEGTRISGLSSGEQLSGEEQSDAMPTGRVVGVLQRNWRDYVASFAENEVFHVSYY